MNRPSDLEILAAAISLAEYQTNMKLDKEITRTYRDKLSVQGYYFSFLNKILTDFKVSSDYKHLASPKHIEVLVNPFEIRPVEFIHNTNSSAILSQAFDKHKEEVKQWIIDQGKLGAAYFPIEPQVNVSTQFGYLMQTMDRILARVEKENGVVN